MQEISSPIFDRQITVPSSSAVVRSTQETISPPNSPTLSTSHQELLKKFNDYLLSPDGGCRANTTNYVVTAKQLLAQVSDIEHINEEVLKLRVISPLEESGASFKTRYGSLVTIQIFLEFLLMTEHQLSENAKGNYQQAILTLLPNWRKSYLKEISQQHLTFQAKTSYDQNMLEGVKIYRSSQFSKKCGDILLALKESDGSDAAVSQQDFCNIRNHLLLAISFTNANRSAVLSNFTLEDYNRSLHNHKEGDNAIFCILQHKTDADAAYGGACIVLNPKQLDMLRGYMRARNHIAAISDRVFVTYAGKAMSQSSITLSISQAFLSAGMGKSASCAKIRKLAVNLVHSKHPTEKDNLAAFILPPSSCHHVKEQNAVQCHTILHDALIMSPGKVSQESTVQEASPECRESSSRKGSLQSTQFHDESPSVNETLETTCIDQSPPRSQQKSAGSTKSISPLTQSSESIAFNSTCRLRCVWNDESITLLYGIFGKMIEEQKYTLSSIDKILRENSESEEKLLNCLQTTKERLALVIRAKLRSVLKKAK